MSRRILCCGNSSAAVPIMKIKKGMFVMEEKLQNLLDCVKGTIVDLSDAAAGVALDAGNKALDLLSVGKMNVALAELEASVLTELRHVGEMIYATHTGKPTDSEVLLEKLREIDELYQQIARLKVEIATAKGLPVCSTCGNVGVKGDIYCRECGRQL